MSILRYSINITLDGCCDHRAGVPDAELHRHHARNLERAGALLFGRVTYQMMEAGWRQPVPPGARPEWMEEFARTIGAKKKYVVSRTLDRVDWNAELVRGDLGEAVRQLKRESSREILTGGVTLPLALAELGLIDEYEFVVQPRIAGHGPTLLAGLSRYVDLKLVSRQELASGALVLRYEPRTVRYYHGTRAEHQRGDMIAPTPASGGDANAYVRLASNVDEAIWDAEVADGDGPARVYTVDPIGAVEDAGDAKPPGRPSMSLRSRALLVTGEISEWRWYHGTRANLKPGDLIMPGQAPNFGDRNRRTRYVYFARTLDAATWGAELAEGSGPGRIYTVEPTGAIEDDPNLTNKRFRGNPTKSFRSREPLRVTGEIRDWKGHAPEAIKAMKEHVAELQNRGVGPDDD